jgi:hypothetical protein
MTDLRKPFLKSERAIREGIEEALDFMAGTTPVRQENHLDQAHAAEDDAYWPDFDSSEGV